MVEIRLKSIVVYWIGIFATLIFCIPIIFNFFNLPTVSDQSLTEGAIMNAVVSGAMDGVYDLLKSWYTYPKVMEEGMALHYPYHLYSVGVLGYVLFQNWAFVLYAVLMAGLIVFFTKKLGDELIRALIGVDMVPEMTSILVWISSLAILSSAWLNGFRFEMLFSTLLLAGLYFVLKFYRGRGSWEAVLGVLFLSFAAVVRQNYTMYAGAILAVFIVQIFVMSSKKSLWKLMPIALLIPIMVIGSYYAFLIKTTGTISYFSENGYPFIDSRLFEPKYLEFDGLNQDLNNEVDISSTFDRMYSGFETQYPSLVKLFHSDLGLREVYRNLNSNLYMNVLAFIPLLVLGAWVWFSKRSAIWYLYLAILVPYLGTWALYTSNPRYLYMHYFLGIFALAIPIVLVISRLKVLYKVISFAFAIIFLVQGVFIGFVNDFTVTTGSYWGAPEGEYMTGVELINQWIIENTDKDDRIFTILQREIALATGRETVWDARLWFVDDVDKSIRYWRDLYKADYILIKDTDVKVGNSYSGPGDIPSDSNFLTIIRSSKLFEEVYVVQDFKVYRFKDNNFKL